MILSREIESKGLNMAITLGYRTDEKKNGKFNVRNIRRVLFGMDPDILAFKVRVCTNDYEF